MKGSYILIIELPEEQIITIGSLKAIYFPRGYYAYVGSAMGRFEPRLRHHLKGNKKPHWHIDYLLAKAAITDIILCETRERIECTIAQALQGQFDAITGFGATDCKCNSHLFFALEEMKSTIMATLNHLHIKPRLSPEYLGQGAANRQEHRR
jgi:Uri superfamily endonuclease